MTVFSRIMQLKTFSKKAQKTPLHNWNGVTGTEKVIQTLQKYVKINRFKGFPSPAYRFA